MGPLEQLEEKLGVIRDRVRGVALGHHTGFYLYGRPGTSKTYTVLKTLDAEGIPHEHKTGHVTPVGLFDMLAEYPDGLIILDDMAQILTQPIAVQILMAALGNGPDGGDRSVEYNRSGRRRQIWFSGRIIMISNLELNGDANSHKIRWQYEAAGPVESTPVIGDDGVIYFGDNAGVIHAVDPGGKALWTAQVEAAVRSAGTILGPKRLAFALDNDTLVVLECSSGGLAQGGWPKYGKDLGQCGLAS